MFTSVAILPQGKSPVAWPLAAMDPLAAQRHRDQGEILSAAFVPCARPKAAMGQERSAASASATRASGAGQESPPRRSSATRDRQHMYGRYVMDALAADAGFVVESSQTSDDIGSGMELQMTQDLVVEESIRRRSRT